jgi:uncharacterized protein YndB with AHSA1/START domain
VTATLHADGDRFLLRLERRLPQPPARVWRALTTPEGLAAWFPARVELDLRVGGAMEFTFTDQDVPPSAGEVLELEPPRRLAFSWGDDELRFGLAPDGDGTRLTFTHRFGDRPMAARQAAGWEVCLDALEGREVPARRWAALHARYAAAWEAGSDGTESPGPAGSRRLRFERRLPHPVERVWAALTDPGELAGWLADAELDLRVGGAVGLRWLDTDDEGHRAVARGTISALEPARVLEYETDPDGRLRWELLAEGDGCLLTFEAEAAVPEGRRADRLAGWHVRLDGLAAALAGTSVDPERFDEEHRPRRREQRARYAARLGVGAGVP